MTVDYPSVGKSQSGRGSLTGHGFLYQTTIWQADLEFQLDIQEIIIGVDEHWTSFDLRVLNRLMSVLVRGGGSNF